MKFLAAHENSQRGSDNFPLELYNIDSAHPRYQMPFHWHLECEIIRVKKGSFMLTLNDSAMQLEAGDSMFIPSGVIHGGTSTDCVYQCIVFSFEKLILNNSIRRLQYEQALGQGDYIPDIMKNSLLVEMLFNEIEKQSIGYEFTVMGIIMQLIGELLLSKSKSHAINYTNADTARIKKIKEVLKLIRTEYTRPLTLSMLADAAGLNLQYLCKSFKRITGKTPIDYLNYYRVECAAELLQLGEMNVTEIAFSCGFNDLSYFIKMFKRHKGVSPRKFCVTFHNK